MSGARLKHYGWGREREGMTAEEQGFVLGRYRAKFPRDALTKVVPRLEDLALRAPRVEPRVDGIRYKAAVTLDLRNLGKVVEVDHYRAQP